MTLTNRLLLFSMSTLALVLCGFSIALYLLAGSYLQRQADERLDAVLHAISGAIETGPEGVEWEPAERPQSLQFGDLEEFIIWSVTDAAGQVVASSGAVPNVVVPAESVPAASEAAASAASFPQAQRWTTGSWEMGRRWFHAGSPALVFSSHSPDEEERHYSSLCVTAGVSRIPMQSALRQLRYTLIGLSAGVWLMAFLLGRFVCRRALRPIQQMASVAGRIKADDLTERLPHLTTQDEPAELSRAFNTLLDRLQQSFEQQRRFTGDASHQLRTPLTAMRGQVEVALRRERSPAEYRDVLKTVNQRTLHLSRLVESLLFLARTDAEACTPELVHVDLKTWLPQHLLTWSRHPHSSRLSLTQDDHAGLLVVRAQVTLLAELLDILIDNALKYSPETTPVVIRTHRTSAHVQVTVEDQGYGLKPEELDFIFQPFYRTEQVRRRGIDGVGLGLSIARRLANVFGGDLNASSHVGRGSCFTLVLAAAVPISRTVVKTQCPEAALAHPRAAHCAQLAGSEPPR